MISTAHVRYPKIDEDTARWAPDPATARWLGRVAWYVTEKVHGAHFEAISDGERVWYAKRGGVLGQGEGFFGFHRVAYGLEERVRALAAALRADPDTDAAATVHVHGELFGGEYPHPQVPAVEGAQAIQTGVYYCPDVAFCAYDIALRWAHRADGASDSDTAGETQWLGFAQALALLTAHDIPTPPVLAVTTWAEASRASEVFESAVPAQLGLPPLRDNAAEGLVIRAADEVMIPTEGGGWARPILKRKHPKFMEDARYHQAQAPAPDRGLPPLTLLEWEAMSRLNPNRVAAARSKLGHAPDLDAWGAEVASDIWAALSTGCADLMARLCAEDRALLRAVLDAECRSAVAPST
jgi:Rnl2 family RNA ligase